jgi:hypothetical protein
VPSERFLIVTDLNDSSQIVLRQSIESHEVNNDAATGHGQ